MLISELLKENEHPKHKSALPKAASINDEPEELELDGELDDEDESEDDSKQEAIDAFKAKAQEVAPGVWALSPSNDPGQDYRGEINDDSLSVISKLANELNLTMPSNDPKVNTDGMIYYFLDKNVFCVWRVPSNNPYAKRDMVRIEDSGPTSELSMLIKTLNKLVEEWTDSYDYKEAVKINKLLKHPRYTHDPASWGPISPEDLERIKFKKYMIKNKKYGDYPEKSYKNYKDNPEYKNFLKHGAVGRGQR